MFWAQVREWGVVGAKAREQEPHAYVIVSVPQGECCGFVGSITLEQAKWDADAAHGLLLVGE